MADSAEVQIEKLTARVRELEDVRDVLDVFNRWHYACTGGFNGVQAGRMEALDCLTEPLSANPVDRNRPG